MKKLLVSLLTAIIAVSCVFCFSACDPVKNGSKIRTLKMQVEVYDASGAVTATTDVYMELYLNFAPKSTEHITKLVNDGYYNGTAISNINSNWMEFGGYEYAEDGKLAKKEYTGGKIEGEFLNNGLQGNKLTTAKGAIIFKRDYDDNSQDNAESKYNTAESTMAICFGSSASTTFPSNSYCILGLVRSDDANENADTELEKKSSIDKLSSLTEYKETKADDDSTVVTYYYEKTGTYYTKWTDEESVAHYAEGAEVNRDAELTDKDLEAFNTLFDENKNYFLVVPCVKLVIKSITVC